MQPSYVIWYQLMLFLVQEPHTSLPYGQANNLNQQSLDTCIFGQKKNLFYNSHYNFYFNIFFCCHSVKICPTKILVGGVQPPLCGDPSNYTTKIPLALLCTIIPLGLVNQQLPFYHFAFVGVCCHGYTTYQLFMIVAFESIVWDLY